MRCVRLSAMPPKSDDAEIWPLGDPAELPHHEDLAGSRVTRVGAGEGTYTAVAICAVP